MDEGLQLHDVSVESESESSEYEVESDSPSLDHVSSDDDEELVEVRRKIQNMRSKLLEEKKKLDDDDDGDGDVVEATRAIEVEEVNELGEEYNIGREVNELSCDSEYANSDGCDSPVFSDEEGVHLVRVPSKYPIFNPKLDVFKQKPILGMRFSNMEELKKCLRNYAVCNGYPIRFVTNKSRKLVAKCQYKCPFKCYATYMQNEVSVQIKSLKSQHGCVRDFNVKVGNAKWLANYYYDRITEDPKWSMKAFKKDIKHNFKMIVNIEQCYRARKKARGDVNEVMKLVYAKLWRYAAEIRRSNPGSTVKIDQDNGVFLRMYVCFDGLKRGYIRGCRKVIGLDGCFLKGFCKGELLTAVGRDGNNQMYPIAWAVVEGENKKSWMWFLDLLIEDLGIIDGNGLTLLTDQQKGLIPAIQELLPNAEHRMCARHIYANFRKRYAGSQLKGLFWKASKSSTPQEFHLVMKEIELILPEAANYLQTNQNPMWWSRAFFGFWACCEAVENNMCECFNGTIVEAREKPIIAMLDDIRLQMMVRMQKKREIFGEWTDSLTPYARKKLEENKDESRFWETYVCGEYEFEVRKGLADAYTVNLKERSCSCRMWQLSGIPCAHAVSSIYLCHDSPDKYVNSWYTLEEYRRAYLTYIKPMRGETMWPLAEGNVILPPKNRRMPGRPKKLRRREGEGPNTSFKVSKAGTVIRCGRCKEIGHNQKTCKHPVPELEPVPTSDVVGNGEGSTRPVVITKCGICREPGHNRKTCTMPEPVPTDKRYKKKQTMPKGTMPEPVPTDKRYKNKQSMPDGIGVWTDSETGNTFMMSGQGPPVNIDDLPHVVDSNHTQLSQASTITNDPQPKRRWPDLLMESPERMHEATTRPVWK